MAEENEESKDCRICLDKGDEKDLIVPCDCKGSMLYIHRECLDHCRSMGGDAFNKCKTCNFTYEIESVDDDPVKEKSRMRWFIFYLVRDISMYLALIVGIIAFLTVLYQSTNSGNRFFDYLRGFTTPVAEIEDGWRKYIASFILALISFFFPIGLYGLVTTCGRDDGACGRSCNPDGCRDCGKCNDKGCGMLIVLIIVVLAIAGFFVGLFYGVIFISELANEHRHKLWNLKEARKYIVVDRLKSKKLD